MRRLLAVLVVCVAALAPLAVPGTASAASVRPFVRDWVGHTRSFHVHRDHTVKETIYSGCCEHVIDVYLRISRPAGDVGRGSFRARVTRVDVFQRYARKDAPHVGDVARLHVRHGVLSESLTGTNYCTAAASRRGTCGA